MAFLLSYIELFFVPRKSAYVNLSDQTRQTNLDSEATSRPLSGATNGTRSDERYVMLMGDEYILWLASVQDKASE